MTTWPARRVGGKILCGRRGSWGACRGFIAYVEDRSNGPWVLMPPGFTVDYPDDDDGDENWRRTARAQDQMARGQTPTGYGLAAPTPRRSYVVTKGRRSHHRLPHGRPPLTRTCDECGVLNRVTNDALVLKS